MKYLVTGNCGFIGQHLTNYLLSQGDDVIGLDTRLPQPILPEFLTICKSPKSVGEFRHVVGSVLDENLVHVLVKEVDRVFHLAAIVGVDHAEKKSDEATAINVRGVFNLVGACHLLRRRMLYLTSVNLWDNVYMNTKARAVEYIRHMCQFAGHDIAICALTHVYGPGQLWYPLHPARKVIPEVIQRVWENTPIQINGDGTQPLDLIHVGDVVPWLARVMNTSPNQTYVPNPFTIDIGSGVGISLTQAAILIASLMGKPHHPITYAYVRSGERANEEIYNIAQNFSLREPVRSLNDGLKETIRWQVGLQRLDSVDHHDLALMHRIRFITG